MFKKDLMESFLHKLEDNLESEGIDLCSLEIDHLCYRVDSEERYDELKSDLALENKLLHEAMISNRPIATFKMKEAFIYKNITIPLLELPSPKPGSDYTEGFEHAEAVINMSFEKFSHKYPHIEFDWKAAKKSHNPELRISFGDISIKFHHHSLEDIIESELNS
ncbi:VOC family protein [Halobacteriovorax sp. HLS]|uniref:VOC family protein n=1 Tax=Halobacteriovorax sp. HLS TaxID=2234000 RepID=UPI000FDAF46F|nr:VOC family protein [Halobacteriovorax sp. HLS]